MKKLLQTIVYSSVNPSEYFATRVNYAVKGLGTKDHLLIRIIITRHEIDIPQIKEAYQNLYNKELDQNKIYSNILFWKKIKCINVI